MSEQKQLNVFMDRGYTYIKKSDGARTSIWCGFSNGVVHVRILDAKFEQAKILASKTYYGGYTSTSGYVHKIFTTNKS